MTSCAVLASSRTATCHTVVSVSWTKTILELKSKACDEDVRPSSEPEVEIHVIEPQTKGWLRLTDTQVLSFIIICCFFFISKIIFHDQ
jgi:hypothetical protein